MHYDICIKRASWWPGDEVTQTKLENRLGKDSVSLKMLSSGTVGIAHLFEVERGEALQVTLWFKQNQSQRRDEMGTWAKSKWLWMALKTTISPAQLLGKSDFQTFKKRWVLQGDLKANDVLLQEKKPKGSFALGIEGGNAQTPTAGLLRCPDRMGCIPKAGDGVNHQALESRGALGLVQTLVMAATSQGARAPCEVGLGGPDRGSPALGGLSTNFYLLAEK